MQPRLYKIIKICFIAFFAFVGICLFFSDQVLYAGKKEFEVSNLLSFLLAVLFAVVIVGAIRALRKRKVAMPDRVVNWTVVILSLIAFFIHLHSAYELRFLGNWDVGAVYSSAWNATHKWQGLSDVADGWSGYSFEGAQDYFSRYPNNRFLFAVLVYFFKALKIVGMNSFSFSIFLCTSFNSVIVILAGLMVYDILRRKCGRGIAFVGYLIQFFLVTLSPWFLVVYSDSLAIFVPVFVFWIASRLDEVSNKQKVIAWALIVATSVFGYYIKPQTIFAFAGCFIFFGVPEICKLARTKSFRVIAKSVGALVLVLFVSFGVKSVMVSTATHTFTFDEQKEFSFTHYFMMSLNDETNGAYSGEDYDFSVNFENKEERKIANLKIAIQRIEEKGPIGLAEHGIKKTLGNWADSSFAWGIDGSFAANNFKDDPCYFKQYVDNCTIPSKVPLNGFTQILWFAVVLAFLGVGLVKKNNRYAAALMVAILFLGLFQLFFEARARYLYAYVPVMIVLAAMVFDSIIIKFNEKSE